MRCVELITKFIKVSHFNVKQFNSVKQQDNFFVHSTFLSAVLVSYIMKLSSPIQLCQLAVPGLTDFLQVAQTWDAALLSGVYSTVFAAIIVEKRHLLQKVRNGTEDSQ